MNETWIHHYTLETQQQEGGAVRSRKGTGPYRPFRTGQKFGFNEEAIQVVNDYFEGLEKKHFREEIGNLEKRWAKCVELREEIISENKVRHKTQIVVFHINPRHLLKLSRIYPHKGQHCHL